MFYAKYFSLILMVHLVLTNSFWKKVFTPKWITIIGGMCYSIYLVHFAVISFAGPLLLHFISNPARPGSIPLYMAYFILLILLISAIYFYFIEQPFMKLRAAWSGKPATK
jgi:peptidoglycan/LPS O-acetylase OafA/YrhL